MPPIRIGVWTSPVKGEVRTPKPPPGNRMRFLLWLALTLLVAVVTAPSACSSTAEVTFAELVAEPARYNGRTVTLEAFYFHSFETSALCASLVESVQFPGHLVPTQPLIWLEGGLPLDVFNQLTEETYENGPSSYYGKLRIKGVFEYGDRYGHVGGFDYQLRVQPDTAEVGLLEWSR